jgi:hypothetical protein
MSKKVVPIVYAVVFEQIFLQPTYQQQSVIVSGRALFFLKLPYNVDPLFSRETGGNDA